MTTENKPVFLLVGNPQTSKNETLPSTDLLKVRPFRRVVEEFDRVLGLPPQGSLQPDRQFASVVMSIAAHSAFVSGLEDRVHPGLLDPRKREFSLVFTGHSAGEFSSLVGAGICRIPTVARILREREEITKHPLGYGFRKMVAVVGVNPDELEAQLNGLTKRFAGRVELFMANYNTPEQAVIVMRGLDEVKTAIDNLGKYISEIKSPNDPEKLLFPKIKLRPLLDNGFHTIIMIAEQRLYMKAIAPWLTDRYFQEPTRGTVYSPTLPGWLTDLDTVYYVTGHILTRPVQFTKAMEDMKMIPGLAAVITSDILRITPKMVEDNKVTAPVINISDRASLEEAIDRTAEFIKQAA